MWELRGHTEDQWEIRDGGPCCSPRPEIPETITEERLRWWLYWETGLTVVTNESWGGTYAGGKLRVDLYEHKKPDGAPSEWSVSVHGTDDWSYYGPRLPDREWALAMMRRIPMVIDSQVLREMGFEP